MKMVLMRQDVPGIEGLKELISHLPDNILGIEVGCYAGESTEIFAASGKFRDLICIDFWKEGFYDDRGTAEAEAAFDLVAARYPLIISKHKADSAVLEKYMIRPDFIYIDADHSYEQVKNDIENALALLNGKGVIAGHDYVPEFPGVIQAVDELVKPTHFFKDSSWLKVLG
jgi:predicted O-methyltransferase YrrM